ncbi:MAG: SGNH/GDSL hydrolase family protein [Bacteroidales bacterium]|nr:SGNH/GDSL hydrolase family protein [Bacteroidales bacterium]
MNENYGSGRIKKLFSENYLLLFVILFGIILCLKSYIKTTINLDYSLSFAWLQKPKMSLLVEGIVLLLLGIFIISLPLVNNYIRDDKYFRYIIPMHMWLFLVLIGIELSLRLTVYNQPFGAIKTNWFGYVFPKNSFYLWEKEGLGITHYDGPPGEIRTPFTDGENIILLGDSFIEGLQVSDNQKFASVAEISLRQDGYGVNLRNFGHSGCAMADYVSLIYGYKELYEPSLIVIQLGDNDFIESFSSSKTNYFLLEDSEIIGIHHSNEMAGDYEVANSISNNFRLMLWKQYGKEKFNQIIENRPSESRKRSIPEEFDVELSKQQMDLLLKAADGTPIVFVLIPHAPKISGNEIIMDDKDHEVLKEFLIEYYPEVTIVDSLPKFQELTESGYLPMGFFNSTTPGWGHLNVNGNKVVGELLAETIEGVIE